jgi:hypothetical protein
MTDIELTVRTAKIYIPRRHGPWRHRLPRFISARLRGEWWVVPAVYAMALPGRPEIACTTKPPQDETELHTLTLPTDQARRLVKFFTTYYTGRPRDTGVTAMDLMRALYDSPMKAGERVSLGALESGRAYTVANPVTGTDRHFMLVATTKFAFTAVTVSERDGLIILAPFRVLMNRYGTRHFYELDPRREARPPKTPSDDPGRTRSRKTRPRAAR